MRIYKYMPREFVDDFLDKGRVLFRTLAYYRDYEDAQIRGDQKEGTRRFAPGEGLAITNHSRATAFTLPHSAFESSVVKDIFVLCASTVFSEELARRFNYDACVEIVDVEQFTDRLRSFLKRNNKQLIHREVDYYNEAEGPGATWP